MKKLLKLINKCYNIIKKQFMEAYLAVSSGCISSIIGNSLIIISLLKNKSLRESYEYQFIYIFSIFDLIQGLFTLIPVYTYTFKDLCIIQGVGIQTSGMAGIL